MDLSGDSETLPPLTTVGGLVSDQQLTRCPTESGGSVLLRLLEFKTHLLEVVEELHIRRDAETRLEDQISKLVLEKQELEWEKESQQHQIETAANQHTESLINVKKQLQAKIRNVEEEKGKYQVSTELKDKEINNLKEELKSLQLLKFNLEKKSSELEQKLSLQSRSKDSHLNQLGEVERRFSALSRQCAVVKQAHEKLEQNVDEAIKINKKLKTANEKQEAAIASLKKELEEVSSKLIKVKMSSVRQDKVLSPSGREQHCQQLHHKLNMETEMNQKLREENVSVRAEKQEVMRSLQNTQQLLLSQTQTVSRVELELQTQREQNQALKQEHRVMRERSSAMEDKVVQLMESFTASKTSWDKEKEKLLCCMEMKQQNLQVVKEAYDELQKEHSQLSSQVKVQAQRIHQLEMRDSSQSCDVSTEIPALIEEIRGEETVNELVSSSDLQPLTSSQTNNPDCLEDTKIMSTGATGVSCVSSPGCRSNNGTVDLEIKEKSDEWNGRMRRWEDDVINIREEGERNEEQQWNKEEVQDEERQEGENGGTSQTTDTTDRAEGSTEDAGDPEQPGTETTDRAEGRKTGQQSAETQIPAQTTTDTTTQQVVDFMDSEPPPPAGCEGDADSRHVDRGHEMRTEEHTFCSDEHQSVRDEREVQRSGSDEENVENPSEATELSGSLNQSDICVLQTNPPLAAQTDVTIQELETTQPTNPSDSISHMKQTDDECVRTTVEPAALSPSQEISEQTGQLKSLETDDGGKKKEDTCVKDACETAQEPAEKLNLKDACADITTDTVDLELEDAGDAKTTKIDLKIPPSHESVSTKPFQQSPSAETLPEDTNDLLKTYKSSFDWISSQRKTTSSRAKSDVSVLDQFTQGSSLFEQKTSGLGSGPGGLLRHPPSSMFLNRKHNKVPVVISRASDLLKASSVSTMRPQQREETLTADVESRASFPASVSSMSWQTTSGRCSRAPPSAAGPSSESDWESSFSQEREDQQSSFRAQISKIEQFLSSERLRLPKRRKTDN